MVSVDLFEVDFWFSESTLHGAFVCLDFVSKFATEIFVEILSFRIFSCKNEH